MFHVKINTPLGKISAGLRQRFRKCASVVSNSFDTVRHVSNEFDITEATILRG